MTDLGDMEHQVESLDKKLRDIVDAVPDIIYRVDADRPHRFYQRSGT